MSVITCITSPFSGSQRDNDHGYEMVIVEISFDDELLDKHDQIVKEFEKLGVSINCPCSFIDTWINHPLNDLIRVRRYLIVTNQQDVTIKSTIDDVIEILKQKEDQAIADLVAQAVIDPSSIFAK